MPGKAPVVEEDGEGVADGGAGVGCGVADVVAAEEVDAELEDDSVDVELEEPPVELVEVEKDLRFEMVIGVATVAGLAVKLTFMLGISNLPPSWLGFDPAGFAPVPVATAATVVPIFVLDPHPY